MKPLLAIETSTTHASLALWRGGEIVFEDGFESDRHHHALLFGPLERALDVLGEDGLGEVIVGSGPGSYSGTRVGIAAAQGVALVHGCAAVGLASLLAAGVREGLAVGDARRGSAWRARVTAGRIPEAKLIGLPELAEELRGNGAAEVFSFEDVDRLALGATVTRRVPTARGLIDAWLSLDEGKREELRSVPPQPVYLRPPHITEAKRSHPLVRSSKG